MSKFTFLDESVLAELKVDSTFIKSVEPEKRPHYRAVLNWLKQYRLQPDSLPREQLRGYIEAFFHLCEVEDWNRAAILSLSLTTPLGKTLHEQLGERTYSQELINIYSQLLGKTKPEIDLICLNGLGNIYSYEKDYQKAIEYYQKAIEYYESPQYSQLIGQHNSRRNILRNLGKAYFNLRKYDQTITYFRDSLETSVKVENRDKGIVALFIRFGNNYSREGDYRKAYEYYEYGLVFARRVGCLKVEKTLLDKMERVFKLSGVSTSANSKIGKILSKENMSYETPKVFISYSHDSQEHKDCILALADRLRSDGIDANIDQYEESPAEGWQRWMLNQVEVSDFVLVICTEQYNRRFRGHEEIGKGRGVTWEGGVIIQELYDSQGRDSEFIPVIFTPQDTAFIPKPLRSATTYLLDASEGYELLYRRLTNQHATPKPELGSIEPLPCRERQQYFLDEQSQIGLKEVLSNASKGILNWKRTLGNNRQIPRPELEQLKNRIATKSSSTTIILGAPGCGKSALMATLGHWAVEGNYAILAIKADYLSNTVNTIEDLQHDIQLNRYPQDAIRAIASQERVILLIDQLDAVSELLDRQPGRLNVLLMLIQSLAETKNVHIIATCREFEFRHGSQFARLDHFERLDLQLPLWDNIAPILEKEHHNPTLMGETLRELLRNPLHLRIFLEIAKPGEVFESFPKLLDRLWVVRIFEQPEAQESIVFLTGLADRMTQEEVLWLPSSIADECPEICRALEQDGILMTNQDNSTLGFCHQTFYDHTLARSFARDSKSLADLVLERQDGLFIRPILLRSLNYIRGTAPQQYQRQLQVFLNTAKQQIRSHILTLLIEFVGAQANPDAVEAGLLIPFLNSETEAIKVLNAMIGSPGWFRRLRDHPEFWQWLKKPSEQANHCVPILSAATIFAENEVWDLLEEYWLNDSKYDSLSIRVILGISAWTPERVGLTKQVLQRYWVYWHDVAEIAEKVAETLPDSAPEIIRAHLDVLLAQASEASKLPPPELLPDADEAQRSFHAYQYNPLNPLKALLKSESNFHEIEKFAEANPKSYLESIWSWFASLIQQLSYDTTSTIISYRWDQVGDFNFSRSEIIQSLLKAITELARQDKSAFFKFFEQNLASDCLAIHRLLAYGLEVVASEEAVFILNYLLDNPRRFNLGSQSSSDSHKETEKLIAAICPYLQIKDLNRLEQSIREFRYSQPNKEMSADFRRKCLKYNREHQLSLLQAIPDQYLSHEARRLKEEEERALPWVNIRKDRGIFRGGFVGPRMTKQEMSRASDKNLLNLLNELSDETGWNNPRRQWSDDVSRAGGAVIQSREFGELVKDDPSRFLRLLPQLEPKLHESYVGEALVDLAETDFPANDLIDIIQDLDRRGFVSEGFHSDTAHALEKIAEKHQGLPQSILALLESWLPTHSQPELAHYRSKEEQPSGLTSPILFEIGSSHMLAGGRGNIVRAIAEGYLRQDPPDLAGWTKFIQSQLGVEPHPVVWVDILSRMPPLLNGDRIQATELFNVVIQNCPEALQYQWVFYFISRSIGRFEPKETVQCWLEMLKVKNSNFSQQAYGELLLVQYLQYQDKWSIERIRDHLSSQDNEAILCGLAHTASNLWIQKGCREIATEILCTLASSASMYIQNAVSNIFRCSRDRFKLNHDMIQIVQAVCRNPNIILEAANDLIEIIEDNDLVDKNPEIAAQICKSLVDIGAELTNPKRSTAFIAESLTTIAIKLHRQPQYREVGLQIFEQLLALNLRETKSALEILDRKPTRPVSYAPPRKRIHRHR